MRYVQLNNMLGINVAENSASDDSPAGTSFYYDHYFAVAVMLRMQLYSCYYNTYHSELSSTPFHSYD